MTTPISFTDTIVNVNPFIPVTLDLPSHSYYHWCHLFNVHLGQCNLLDHITAESVPRPADPCWVKDDLIIIQWIYTRVSIEIVNLMFNDASTAADLWASLRQLFQDNVEARITSLNSELHNTIQGDSTLAIYCQRIKSTAD
jgi:hypothetical protein